MHLPSRAVIDAALALPVLTIQGLDREFRQQYARAREGNSAKPPKVNRLSRFAC